VSLDVVHHCECIDSLSSMAHQGSQLLIRDDEATIVRILQLVLLDVLPGSLHILSPGGLLLASDASQGLVSFEDLVNVVVATIFPLGGALGHGAV